jgi:hypothetical protein
MTRSSCIIEKEFIDERRRMLPIYEHLLGEESTMTHQYDVKSLMKSLATRWSDLVRKSDELTGVYDVQYRVWFLFESEMSSFREQILVPLEQRLQSVLNNDIHRMFDHNRIDLVLNELKVS